MNERKVMPLVDHGATQALGLELSFVVKGHYDSRPTGQSTIFEVLNALACVAAVVLAGTGNDKGARAFFDNAVDENIEDALRGERRERVLHG